MKEVKIFCDLCGKLFEKDDLELIDVESCNITKNVELYLSGDVCWKCKQNIRDYARSIKNKPKYLFEIPLKNCEKP